MSEDLVERIARRFFEYEEDTAWGMGVRRGAQPTWEDEPAWSKEVYRRDARRILREDDDD